MRPCVFLHFRAFRLGICEGFGFRGLRIFRDHLGLSEILLFEGLQFLTACLLRTLQFERGVGGRGGMGGGGMITILLLLLGAEALLSGSRYRNVALALYGTVRGASVAPLPYSAGSGPEGLRYIFSARFRGPLVGDSSERCFFSFLSLTVGHSFFAHAGLLSSARSG